ncbi:cytochrome P450 87A3-like [Dendrobium catenatum]|nr:cytochrome P450 87A3-like [Dendrobium catenatum]
MREQRFRSNTARELTEVTQEHAMRQFIARCYRVGKWKWGQRVEGIGHMRIEGCVQAWFLGCSECSAKVCLWADFVWYLHYAGCNGKIHFTDGYYLGSRKANSLSDVWEPLVTCVDHQVEKLFFDVIAKTLISYDPSTTTIDLMRYLKVFISSVFSFPFNIPGTAYHRSLQGRKIVMNLLKTLLSERMKSPRKESKDFLDLLVDELGKENSMLTEKSALNLIFVLLIASFVSSSRTISLATKFLSEDPKILKDLTDEHEEVLRNRDEPDSQITWEEYKSMSFTQQVIKEAGRLANIVPASFRKTIKDFAINGYVIPKDWLVMIYPPATHLNPQIHEDPLTFNPSRWEGKPESNRGEKNYLVFGGGIRYCIGAEFSKLEMAIFLHYFVTKCRWKDVKGGNIVRSPGLEFPDGYHIQVMPKNVGVL